MLEALNQLSKQLVAKDFFIIMATYESTDHAGVVMTGKVGTTTVTSEFAVWYFDKTGATYTGFYTGVAGAAQQEFNSRVRAIQTFMTA